MSAQTSWVTPPDALSLSSGDIHVWRVDLARTPQEVTELARTLTADELARASRFRFERDRRRYVVARGVLRRVLGRTLGLAPGDVCLQYGAQGKPVLAAIHSSDLQFNVAHSHELALVALARGRALGVDVEFQRQLDDAQRIAQRFFSSQEVAALMTTPVGQRAATFFRIWTRKEAFIKATGKGLSQPLDAFNVMSAIGAALIHVEVEGAPTPWRLWDLFPGPRYGAALVVWEKGEPALLRQFEY